MKWRRRSEFATAAESNSRFRSQVTAVKSGLILVIDEDTRSRQCLRSILTANGYEVQEADSPKHGRECLSRACADLVILEANLTASTGRARAWRKFAAKSQVALIAIGKRNSEQEEVAALEAGVDDYIRKPFSTPRLLARIAAVLRRRIHKSTGKKEKVVVQLEDRQIDLGTHCISSNGRQIRLTPIDAGKPRNGALGSRRSAGAMRLMRGPAADRLFASLEIALPRLPLWPGLWAWTFADPAQHS